MDEVDLALPPSPEGPGHNDPVSQATPDTVAAPRIAQGFPILRLGNLRLAAITLPDAIDWIVQRAENESPCVVVTSNIFHLMLAQNDHGFQGVTATCELNVADGWPLVAASRLLGTPVPERIAGVDLVAGLFHVPQQFRVAILGGAPGVAELLAARFRAHHQVVFVDPLEKGVWDTDQYLESMRHKLSLTRPNLVLVGIGAPRQELLSDRLRDVVCGPIIGCGQTIDVLGGARARAPRMLQAAGLEWAFRMTMEPRRLGRRYAVAGFWFIRLLGRELRHKRRSGGRTADGGR
ncbi:MAG: N-acetylglucosaminyldiphosphoundecaprenol N-acetyl-beta-D-mannosaminyltransferase [Gaiellales bacterium]|jgi:N-acetylglucosaminyldiphosphoundecaprenol N-acetyl-beta-D-mannosaminyltransferase|nr:N-acetylglucosaminyldiphosphoundecaprenol N-acetyl-beta-D-mannosaminyltransferase [Gaiellales bacterium]